jgi:hypothetical protein
MQEATRERLHIALVAIQTAAQMIDNDTNGVLASGELVPLIQHFAEMRDVNEQIKLARKHLEILEDRLSKSEIPDLFRAKGVKTITVQDLGRVTVSYRWACSIIDKVVGHAWLRDNGHEGLITETVNSSTLAAFAKDLNDTEGTELPADKFKTSRNPFTSITKV